MDPLRSYLGRLLLEDITPVVMVLTTPLVEAACRKSGLSFVDMLSPFSLFKKIDVPVRTASDQPYRHQMFKIRMVYASDVRKQDYEVADERIKTVVSKANENALSDLLADPPQLEDGPCSLLDFILISKAVTGNSSKSEQDPQLLSNHTCHCSALSQNPIWWLMEGPRTITHDFSKSYCEANIQLAIHNSAEHNISVRLVTFDGMPEKNQTVHSHDSASGQGGWYDVSLENDIKTISSAKGTHSQKQSSESISPFVWCSLSSAQVDLKPDSSAKVPLKVCIFTPGTYNFSNYELHWKVHPSEGGQVDENGRSGVGQGHPFYVTVLQGAQ